MTSANFWELPVALSDLLAVMSQQVVGSADYPATEPTKPKKQQKPSRSTTSPTPTPPARQPSPPIGCIRRPSKPQTAPPADTRLQGHSHEIIGIIRPDTTEETSAKGDDYTDAREKLLASVPEGYSLLHVRREGQHCPDPMPHTRRNT